MFVFVNFHMCGCCLASIKHVQTVAVITVCPRCHTGHNTFYVTTKTGHCVSSVDPGVQGLKPVSPSNSWKATHFVQHVQHCSRTVFSFCWKKQGFLVRCCAIIPVVARPCCVLYKDGWSELRNKRNMHSFYDYCDFHLQLIRVNPFSSVLLLY